MFFFEATFVKEKYSLSKEPKGFLFFESQIL
uniref:Uncharacterized protein n=1 Tax=viral metagenome TaxID=1070528 RepID=A0A6C0AET1_9ZZZZ